MWCGIGEVESDEKIQWMRFEAKLKAVELPSVGRHRMVSWEPFLPAPLLTLHRVAQISPLAVVINDVVECPVRIQVKEHELADR